MSPDRAILSPNFTLDEFLPRGWDGSVPLAVRSNLIILCDTLLEPARAYIGRPIHCSSGYRPPLHNAEVGGVKDSDHTMGRAADVWVTGTASEQWQDATIRLFHWMRTHMVGKFGQLILEDHRSSKGRPTALWLHVSIPSTKHPGSGDHNAVLVSPEPGRYLAYEEPSA